MSNNDGKKLFFWLIGGFTVVLLLIIILFSVNEQKNSLSAQVAAYSAGQTDKPQVETADTFSDLGTMKVSQEKTGRFTLTNDGNKPLQLFDITSSCGCTVGQIDIGGIVSPEFGMHSKSNWVGKVQPGQSAAVSVIYRPFVMPVKGIVNRDVYIHTNDPDHQLLTFTVKADVQ